MRKFSKVCALHMNMQMVPSGLKMYTTGSVIVFDSGLISSVIVEASERNLVAGANLSWNAAVGAAYQ